LLHDIQAPGFNIDHVVVSPGGVFAVETKHRLKPTQGNAKEQALVTFDGKVLHFLGWQETKPIEQARAQARWLSERLTKSTGLPVQARPVVALPGWFVDCRAPSDVVVTNPKSWQFMLKPRRNEPGLAPDSIQRITFQVEQLCRLPAPEESRSAGRSPREDQSRTPG
jgi:Nuclease-related domain